jgi:hypothetical protein
MLPRKTPEARLAEEQAEERVIVRTLEKTLHERNIPHQVPWLTRGSRVLQDDRWAGIRDDLCDELMQCINEHRSSLKPKAALSALTPAQRASLGARCSRRLSCAPTVLWSMYRSRLKCLPHPSQVPMAAIALKVPTVPTAGRQARGPDTGGTLARGLEPGTACSLQRCRRGTRVSCEL